MFNEITEGCFYNVNSFNCFLAISDTKSISSLAGSTNAMEAPPFPYQEYDGLNSRQLIVRRKAD